MLSRKLTSLLINFCLSATALAAPTTPRWITEGKLSDSTYFYVICSHDGLDPDDVKQVAESKCIASAAKLGEVTVTVRQKTIQSLTGADSAEVAEIQPLTKNVSCEWLDRYTEQIESGVRIWLRCRVLRKNVGAPAATKSALDYANQNLFPNRRLKYKRALLRLATVPNADRIIVLTNGGERTVVEVKSNLENIELIEGDVAVVVKKQKYRDQKIELGGWSHGDQIAKTVYLQKEM